MTLEEALAVATVDDGPVDDIIKIDAQNKIILLPVSEMLFGVEGEKDVERKHFKCPRIVGDGIDLYTHQIYVNYIFAENKNETFKKEDLSTPYWCDDVALDETGNYITFSWSLSGNVLAHPGFIAFAIVAKYVDGEALKTRWKTTPAIGTVLMTVPDSGQSVAELYPDVITQLLQRMDEVEGIATPEAMREYVDEWFRENEIIDETLTQENKAAPASAVGELKEDLTDLIIDKNHENIIINSADYSMQIGAIINGKYQTEPAYMMCTTDYIDLAGIKELTINLEKNKLVYIHWYAEKNEESYIGAVRTKWISRQEVKLLPAERYMRIVVKNDTNTAITEDFANTSISLVGSLMYNEMQKNKSFPYGYSILDINDKFVQGAVGEYGNIVTAESIISTDEYIDIRSIKSMSFSNIPSDKYVTVMLFEKIGGKLVYRLNDITGIDNIDDNWNYAKISIISRDTKDTFTGDAFDISFSVLRIQTGLKTKNVKNYGNVISNNYLGNSKLQITSENDATVIVSNNNMLIMDYYESRNAVTKNGVTFTVNVNGSITANGTATADADFMIRPTSAPIIPVPYNIPLYFSCLVSESDNYFACLSGSSQADLGNGVILQASKANNISISSIYIRIRSGKTADNVTFYPMLTVGTKKNEYVCGAGTVLTNVTKNEVRAYDGTTIICSTDDINVVGQLSVDSSIEKNFEEHTSTQAQHGWRSNNHIVSICHRGFLTEAPENTIYAFRKAVDGKIDYLESDIWFTSDHVPVMFHDPKIDRVVKDHTGAIRDYSLAEIKEFDVSSYFKEANPNKWDDKYADAKIMTFEEYLRFCKGVGVPTMLEIKDTKASASEVESVIDLIKKYDFADCIMWFGSLTSYINLYPIINAFPKSIVNLGVDGTSITKKHIDLSKSFRTGKNIVGIATDNYTENDVVICKQYKIPLTVYMIDTLSQALNLDPYIHAALSNSICVREELRKYYMGEAN